MDPFDEHRGDIRNAMLMQLLANQNRDRKKRPSPYLIDEFLPFKAALGRTSTDRDPELAARRRSLLAARRTANTALQKVDGGEEDTGAKLSPETLTFLFVKAGVKPPKGN